MQHFVRVFSSTVFVAVLLAGTACSSNSLTTNENSDSGVSASQAAADFRQERANALLDYVEAERATVSTLRENFAGLYSEIRAEGTLETQDGSRGLRAGEYAVIWYYYTYAQPMDWGVTMDALDAQRTQFDQLCESTIFPAMAGAGVVGPKSAVWSYSDSRSEFGPMWSHTCSRWESTAQQ